MCCIYSLIIGRTFIHRNTIKIFVQTIGYPETNVNNIHMYVRHKIRQVCFPRICRWRVVSPRGICCRHKQQLAVWQTHVIILYVQYYEEGYVLYLFIYYLQNVHTQKVITKDLRLSLANKRNHARTARPGMTCVVSINRSVVQELRSLPVQVQSQLQAFSRNGGSAVSWVDVARIVDNDDNVNVAAAVVSCTSLV